MAAKPSAADAAPTTVTDTAPDTPQPETWLYSGSAGRIYAHIPVTPEPGDVLAWHGLPADDGCWTATDRQANRKPDNYRPEPANTVTEG